MILIAGKDRAEITELSLRLYRNGIPSTAATVRTVSYHMQKGFYDCLILLSPPAGGARSRAFYRSFHERFPHVPVVLVGHTVDFSYASGEAPDLIVKKPYTPVSLLKEIDRCAAGLGTRSPLSIRVGTVLHDVRNAVFTSFHACISLPAAQTAILHTLMAMHPTPIPASLLLRLAAKPGYPLRPSSLFPHISRLNARTYEAFGRRLVAFSPKCGYYFNTKKG